MFRILIGILVGSILLMVGIDKVRAQSEIDFGKIENQLRIVADQNTSIFMDALKLAAKDISPISERDAFVTRLIEAVFPGRDYQTNELGIEEWERLRDALIVFQGKVGGQLDGQSGDTLFLTVRSQLELINE